MTNHVQLNFDATTVAPSQGVNMDPIPKGRYRLAASDIDYKPGGKPNTMVLAVEHTVQEGTYKGRKVFENLNLQNPSALAQEIGWGNLSAWQRACGVIRSGSSADLIGKIFEADVGIEAGGEKRDDLGNVLKTYPDKNKILKYYHLSGVPLEQIGAGGAPAPGFVPPPTAAAAPGLAPPAAAVHLPPPAPSAPPAASPSFVMTAKAGGVPYGDFIAKGWTPEQMVAQGFIEPARAPAPTLPPAPPAAPAPPVNAATAIPPGMGAPAPGFVPTAPGMGGGGGPMPPSATMPPAAPGAPGPAGGLPTWMQGAVQQ